MKKHKGVEYLFSNKAYLFDEQPSTRSWQVLQNRLKIRKRKQRNIFTRIWTTAAAVTLVVSLFFFVQYWINNTADIQFEVLNTEIAEKDEIIAQVHLFRKNNWQLINHEGDEINKSQLQYNLEM